MCDINVQLYRKFESVVELRRAGEVSRATNLTSENIDKQFPSRYNHIIVNGL